MRSSAEPRTDGGMRVRLFIVAGAPIGRLAEMRETGYPVGGAHVAGLPSLAEDGAQ
jgi:hypothetical protein